MVLTADERDKGVKMTKKLDVKQILSGYKVIKARACAVMKALQEKLNIMKNDAYAEHDPTIEPKFNDVHVGTVWYKSFSHDVYVPIELLNNWSASGLRRFVTGLVFSLDDITKCKEWERLQQSHENDVDRIKRYEELKAKFGGKK